MTTQAIDDRVLEKVKRVWDKAHVKSVQISNMYPSFVRGSLYVVEINDADGDDQYNYVYVVNNELKLFEDINQLAYGVGKVSTAGDVLQSMIQFGGIAGVIAIIITATICYLVATRDGFQIPNTLGNALTMILGFYFGTAVHKTATTRDNK